MVLTSDPRGGRTVSLWWNIEPACEMSIRMPADPAAYARGLYEALHTADAGGWDWIAIEPVPDDDAWAGVRDRLVRASAK